MASNYIPTFEIFKGGENITARFQDRALSIKVRLASGAGEQDFCEIVLDDRGWAIASPQVGDRLDISLGYADIGVAYMGSFEINKVVYRFNPKTISIIGTAATSLNDIKSQKIKHFENKNVGEILSEFGSAIGIGVDVHPDIAKNKIPTINNIVSFQSFVARLEKQYNAIAKFRQGKLSLTPRDSGRSVSDFATPTYVFRPEHLTDAEVYVDAAPAYAKTNATYRDKATHELKKVTAATKAKENKSTAEYSLNFREFPSQDEAQAAADSTQAQLDRATGKISATLASGDPWIRDGQRVLVTEARDGVNGSYLVDLVEHRFSKDSGLRTTFSGSAGDAGLPEAYASGSGTESFLTLGPTDFVFGQALKEPSLTLGQPSGSSVPSLFGSAPPSP